MRNNLIVRCSSLSKIMTKGRSKTEMLGETAKSYIMEQAKEEFYGIKNVLSAKQLDKGNINEVKAIEMLNNVRFMDFRKNEIRKTTDWLTGEADIIAEDRIIDIKNSWSFDSFPCFGSEAEKKVKASGYDWQVRGYMLLFDKPKAEVVYCMTSTPDELLSPYDDLSLHKVDNIDPALRITAVTIERDSELEDKMLEQYKVANEFYHKCIDELTNKNKTKWT